MKLQVRQERGRGIARRPRREKARQSAASGFDLPPLDLGRMLRPLGEREEWYDEMLEGRV